jgi:peptidyl-prolyl cis-trans isomerase D
VAVHFPEDQATRYAGGDLGWITDGIDRGALPGPVTAALATLTEQGQLSGVIDSPGGFHLLKFMEISPEAVRPFAAVRGKIVTALNALRHGQDAAALQAALDGIPVSLPGGP